MAVKYYKPTTPGQRGMTTQDFSAITTKKPVKSLLTIKKSTAGRNNQGRITTRHRGGGARRYYRNVNFKLSVGTSAVVEQIEYDPNRSARIARIKDQEGSYHYILAAKSMKLGSKIVSGEETPITRGNRLPLKNIPTGTTIHAIELQPDRGAQLVRSAGAGAQLVAKDGDWAQVRLPSGEIRLISINAMASIGTVGNDQHSNVKIGKAGRKRHMGFRPTVRGVAMNAVDHPHGGGEAKGKGGNHPRTPWGQPTLGYKTRHRRKTTGKFIVRGRREAKRK